MYEATIKADKFRLRFMSYTTGFRPDVLDVNDMEVAPNPLEKTETGVEWTHCLGGRKGARYLLLIEKLQGGIFPSTVERYLQWLIDKEYPEENENSSGPIVVSLEPEPGKEFLERLNKLTRIRTATFRLVRPNPGWADLESELAGESLNSDAHKTEVTMTARRGQTLNWHEGIVQFIKNGLRRKTLPFARIEGAGPAGDDKFDTVKLGMASHIPLKLDANGQVEHQDAWRKLGKLFDELE